MMKEDLDEFEVMTMGGHVINSVRFARNKAIQHTHPKIYSH